MDINSVLEIMLLILVVLFFAKQVLFSKNKINEVDEYEKFNENENENKNKNENIYKEHGECIVNKMENEVKNYMAKMIYL